MLKKLVFLVLATSTGSAFSQDDLTDCLMIDKDIDAQKCLVQKGKPFSRIGNDGDGGRFVVDSPSAIVGDYSQYLKKMSDINSPLFRKALENDGKRAKIKIGKVSASGDYTVSVAAQDSGEPISSGAVVLSNLGPDISGRDIVSWYNRSRLGGGFALTSSFSHGFSDIRPQSKGGRYETAYLSLENASPIGLSTLSYIYSENKAGGEAKLFELGGKTHKVDMTLKNYIGNNWSVESGAEYTKRFQDIGVFNIMENQSYSSIKTEVERKWDDIYLSLGVKKGVTGSRDYNFSPLMGTFNPHFSSATLKAGGNWLALSGAGGQILSIKTSATGFVGTKDMPSGERLGVGGAGAGSSHESGVYSGYKGYTYQFGLVNKVAQSLIPGVLALEAGVNGGHVKTATGQDIGIDSFEVGAILQVKDWNIRVAHSESISTKNIDGDKRITAQLTWLY